MYIRKGNLNTRWCAAKVSVTLPYHEVVFAKPRVNLINIGATRGFFFVWGVIPRCPSTLTTKRYRCPHRWLDNPFSALLKLFVFGSEPAAETHRTRHAVVAFATEVKRYRRGEETAHHRRRGVFMLGPKLKGRPICHWANDVCGKCLCRQDLPACCC